MANTIAKSMTDGNNTAYFMDKIKSQNGKIILYSSENPSMTSETNFEIEIPDISISGEYFADDYITEEQANTDCTTQLQSLIDNISNNGNGGTIVFGNKVYKLYGITLKPLVSLKGASRGSTVLQKLKATNEKSAALLENSARNYKEKNGGLIYVPIESACCNIDDLVLCGPITSGVSPSDWNTIPSDNEVCHGIKIEDMVAYDTVYNANGSISSNPGDTMWSGGNRRVDAYEILAHNTTNYNSSSIITYKNLNIRNCYIYKFTGCGLYIGIANYSVNVDNLYSSYNLLHGIQTFATDCMFLNLILEQNGRCGLNSVGGNCKYENIKSCWNGTTEAKRCSKYIQTSGANSPGGNNWDNSLGTQNPENGVYGIRIQDKRSAYVNLEVQDNYCSGILISGSDNSITNLLSDANGYTVFGVRAPADDTGSIRLFAKPVYNLVEMRQSRRNRVFLHCTQYHYENNDINSSNSTGDLPYTYTVDADWAFYINGSYYNKVEILEQYNNKRCSRRGCGSDLGENVFTGQSGSYLYGNEIIVKHDKVDSIE